MYYNYMTVSLIYYWFSGYIQHMCVGGYFLCRTRFNVDVLIIQRYVHSNLKRIESELCAVQRYCALVFIVVVFKSAYSVLYTIFPFAQHHTRVDRIYIFILYIHLFPVCISKHIKFHVNTIRVRHHNNNNNNVCDKDSRETFSLNLT